MILKMKDLIYFLRIKFRVKFLILVKDKIDFDIICFQEVFGFLNSRKHKMIYAGLKKGLYYHASSPSPAFLSSYLSEF